MRRLLLPVLFLTSALFPSARASALSISAEPGPGCFSLDPTKCIGGNYSLTVASMGGSTFQATYTMDLTSGLEIPATSIEQIDFKVANGYQDPLSVVLAPDATGNWGINAGPLSGTGCKGTNGSFICLDAVTALAVAPTTYTWKVQFDSTGGLLPESDWHIGARFDSPNHPDGWVLSAGGATAPIPEARSSLTYAAGALLVSLALLRRAQLAA